MVCGRPALPRHEAALPHLAIARLLRAAKRIAHHALGRLLAHRGQVVPGVSVLAAPMADALGMSATRFLVFEVVAVVVWTLAFMALGMVFMKPPPEEVSNHRAAALPSPR
jgi:membrane protein DedA with SNARE-associated domain